MDLSERKGAEEARSQLPHLLDAAEQGRATVVTRRGRAVAVVAPVGALDAGAGQASLEPLAGSGRGLWTSNSIETLRRLRQEWRR